MESCEALWKLNWEMRPEIARLTLIAVYKADLQFALPLSVETHLGFVKAPLSVSASWGS